MSDAACRQRRSKVRLDATIGALFRRCPALCGFTVQHSGGLSVGELTIEPWGGHYARGAAAEEIVFALVGLIDECPEACELLGQRTFARALH